jgi:hypothetical protein
MIHIFQRHCNTSANSIGKQRPDWFSRERCFNNLIKTVEGRDDIELHIMFDGIPDKDHFINKHDYLINKYKGGTDGHSFLNVVNHIEGLPLEDDDIIYFLEDDYLHQEGWVDIMLEAFTMMNPEYDTLYDHRDKYENPGYQKLQSKVIATTSVHWRTTPSTTNTYACKVRTFKKHLDIHKEYCDLEKGYTRDHDKFLRLWNEGSNLVSSIPGFSTHVETIFLSPVVNWENYSYIYSK